MLIVMKNSATQKNIQNVTEIIESHDMEARPIPGGDRVSIAVLKNRGAVNRALFVGLPGVKEIVPVTRPYKLVSRETNPGAISDALPGSSCHSGRHNVRVCLLIRL